MTDPFFFGYGSLVNRRTHIYTPAVPATLEGWRREWRPTAMRGTAFLHARPEPSTEIDGLIAPVPAGDWAALDAREAGYARQPATTLRHGLHPAPSVSVYSIPPSPGEPETLPILLSYLDVVVQGFWDEFGEDGVTRFFETTDNWHMPVADDRAAPLYARSQALETHHNDAVDHWLKTLGSDIVPAAAFDLTPGNA